MSKGLKTTYSVLVVIVVLALGYYFLHAKAPATTYQAVFRGALYSIKGNVITIQGKFISTDPVSNSLPNVRNYSVTVDSTTQFKKTGINLPTIEYLKSKDPTNKTGVYSYKLGDVPTSETVGSLQDLASSTKISTILVDVDFPISVFSKNPVATSISYSVLIFPPGNK